MKTKYNTHDGNFLYTLLLLSKLKLWQVYTYNISILYISIKNILKYRELHCRGIMRAQLFFFIYICFMYTCKFVFVCVHPVQPAPGFLNNNVHVKNNEKEDAGMTLPVYGI